MGIRTGDRRPRAKSIFFVMLFASTVLGTSLEALELVRLAFGSPVGFAELLGWSTPALSLARATINKHWLVSAAASAAAAEESRALPASPPSQPIRVLHYMGTNFGMTGVETFILQLTAAQQRTGLVPSVAMDLTDREEVRTILTDSGIAVHDLPARGSIESKLPRKLGTAVLRARRIRALVQLLRNCDVLHIQAVGISCLDGFVAAKLARTRALIVTHHGTLSWFAAQRDLLSDATFWIEKRMATRVVMPYASAAAELVAEGIPQDRTSVIPFCVDEQLFSGRARSPASGELTLVMAARMYYGKGQIHLLAALAKILPRYPKVRAVFIGDGPTRPEIEAEIDRLGLRGVVASKGRVDHREIPALMRSAHVVVLPSYMTGEMFPLCLIEGMALGLPAIGTRFSGIPEIIADGETGILVEPRDEEALERAILRYLEEPGFYSRAQQNALVRFRSRFAATAVARAYLEHYQSALQDEVSA